jgi:hypothetical protein
MLTLIEFNLVPLAISAAIGFVTGLWIVRGGRKDSSS